MLKLFEYALESDPLGSERVLVAVVWFRFSLECGVLCMCMYVN